ncbi:MAG: hypothetical protein J7619_07625 [Dyadobacter sp.]|uniref:hypothetical protein n=1 Tax=Dyadobacter sp. TaxID=1914288 RepID=UPI001B29B9C0|nr:hypothetical protein [Dyadobacter sp.]MBO9612547.1 hypothetical protein [Dyadobacter sp.]
MSKLDNFSETSVKLTLGGHEYVVRFGITSRRRIEELHPGFDLTKTEMPEFEIILFLIQNGIEPEDRKWKNEAEFIRIFEECTDAETLSKVPLAFMNAMGFTGRVFAPAVGRLFQTIQEIREATQAEAQSQSSTGETTGETQPK